MACSEDRQLLPFRRRGSRWGKLAMCHQIPCKFSPFLSRDCQPDWIPQGDFFHCEQLSPGQWAGDHVSGISYCPWEASRMAVKCVQGSEGSKRGWWVTRPWAGKGLREGGGQSGPETSCVPFNCAWRWMISIITTHTSKNYLFHLILPFLLNFSVSFQFSFQSSLKYSIMKSNLNSVIYLIEHIIILLYLCSFLSSFGSETYC